MRKRNIVKFTLTRNKTETILKFWVAPEVEAVFKESAVNKYGNDYIEKSGAWFDENKEGLRFYKKEDELNNKLSEIQNRVTGYPIINDFGKTLFDGRGCMNIALLRVVGVSEGKGVNIKTDSLIGYEELKRYVEMLGEWIKVFYRDYIKKSKITATIACELY